MTKATEVLKIVKNNKNPESIFVKIRQATRNIRQGIPTVEDYRLVLQYPGMASLYMRK